MGQSLRDAARMAEHDPTKGGEASCRRSPPKLEPAAC